MDPRKNPYAPGAGTPPPELAGRDAWIERAAIALDRIRSGRSARSLILHGLRGVGKTVLLNRIEVDAEARGFASVKIEAPEGRSLPALLIPILRVILLRLDRGQRVRAALGIARKAFAGFVNAWKIKYKDIEISTEFEPERGLADSGHLDIDLTELLTSIGHAAREYDTAVALFIDELQYVRDDELASLIRALHEASQRQLPITMLAAGLPQLIGQMGRAKSYAERLFEFVQIDRLDDHAARAALCIPAKKEHVDFEPLAIKEILDQTQGYPYFLQEWGRHAWNLADASPISRSDAERATTLALAELDDGFFRVRFDRLTRAEKRYLRAMAELGAGPHRSGDIAERLRMTVTSAAPLRNRLIAKGMIYSPAHGDTAFTVPLFDGFMKRILPKMDA
ncbi:ATP-binding protein [Methylacidimicrobium sp. B4]|uniref:ATP-binding protein n=1 Tax=Methylacidimicrobium sp. B4 TaxID=2796139 RepID=UPI001A8C4FFD|nr:ATP-binding protein [Methylacidimicrobium sp. B4]QSR84354.1 ATP-binding protein [Methylacidimicrobium sp. B4]